VVIILCLYVVALWLVFSKFKLVRWGWLSGTISLLVGGFILAAFLALFNYLTPSGTLVRTDALGATVFPRPASAGDVRQPHRVCRQRGRDRSSGVDSGVDWLLHGISLAGRTQNVRMLEKSAHL